MEEAYKVYQGDALLRLRELTGAGFSAIISDPPYASGGMSMSEKSRSTREKYTSYGEQGKSLDKLSARADGSGPRLLQAWGCVRLVCGLAAASRADRCHPMGWMGMARRGRMGQNEQQAANGTLSPAM